MREKIQGIVTSIKQHRQARALARANVRAGGYTNGTPMSDEDKFLHKVLGRVGIGLLVALAMTAELVIILGVTGQ